MWKSIRIVVLLVILLVVAINAWRDQNQNWDRPVTVLLHPINADQRSSTQQYIDQLTIDQFKDIQKYLSSAAAPYRIQPVYFYFQLGRPLQQLPPKVPEQAGLIDVILWSLKFRFYAWKNSMRQEGSPSVTLYLNFYDPQFNRILKHSTALEKGESAQSTCLLRVSRYNKIRLCWCMSCSMHLEHPINMISILVYLYIRKVMLILIFNLYIRKSVPRL